MPEENIRSLSEREFVGVDLRGTVNHTLAREGISTVSLIQRVLELDSPQPDRGPDQERSSEYFPVDLSASYDHRP